MQENHINNCEFLNYRALFINDHDLTTFVDIHMVDCDTLMIFRTDDMLSITYLLL